MTEGYDRDVQLPEPPRPDRASPPPSTPPKKPRLSKGAIVALVIGGLIVLGWIGSALDGDSGGASDSGGAQEAPAVEGTRFEQAFETVGVTSKYITVEDSGASIIVDGPSDDTNTNTFYPDLGALLTALDVPSYVVDQIDSTTSLQGLREATWDGIEASWSYHPDNGLDLILVDTEA